MLQNRVRGILVQRGLRRKSNLLKVTVLVCSEWSSLSHICFYAYFVELSFFDAAIALFLSLKLTNDLCMMP